jgi:hypothetical protein
MNSQLSIKEKRDTNLAALHKWLVAEAMRIENWKTVDEEPPASILNEAYKPTAFLTIQHTNWPTFRLIREVAELDKGKRTDYYITIKTTTKNATYDLTEFIGTPLDPVALRSVLDGLFNDVVDHAKVSTQYQREEDLHNLIADIIEPRVRTS